MYHFKTAQMAGAMDERKSFVIFVLSNRLVDFRNTTLEILNFAGFQSWLHSGIT